MDWLEPAIALSLMGAVIFFGGYFAFSQGIKFALKHGASVAPQSRPSRAPVAPRPLTTNDTISMQLAKAQEQPKRSGRRWTGFTRIKNELEREA